jgi:cation diffusion facilitator family transporter
MDNNEKKALAIRVTLIGSALDLFLGVGKIICGILFFSHALIIDGVHSLSDILTDGFVLLVTKYAHEEPDEEHPYGHARFETFGTIVIGLLLILLAFFLAKDSIDRYLLQEAVTIPRWPALIIAFISIISKEWIYRYTLSVGQKINSQLIIANAWHSRSDAFTSILVFVSLILSMNGLHEVDILTAVIISGFIGKIGWEFMWGSIKELVDTSLDSSKLMDIKNTIMEVHGVKSFHNLRSRKMGDKAILDVNIEVDNNLTVSEGHEIASWVVKVLIDKYTYLFDVTVHTDVEDDRADGHEYMSHKEVLLPLRNVVTQDIENSIGTEKFNLLQDIRIHYIFEKINLEIIVEDSDELEIIRKNLKTIPYVRTITFLSKLS